MRKNILIQSRLRYDRELAPAQRCVPRPAVGRRADRYRMLCWRLDRAGGDVVPVNDYPEYAMQDWRDDGQAAHELELDREEAALDALMNCKRAGAGLEHLNTLAAELGLADEWQQYQEAVRP